MGRGRRALVAVAAALVVSLVGAREAQAVSTVVRFVGGTAAERTEVQSALAVSSFDWNVVARDVVVHFGSVDSYSTPGHVWLDRDLLRAGVFSWAVIQDEFAHQIDYFLFDETTRAQLTSALGGKAWCHHSRPGLRHGDYGCERFASTFVWAFWPSPKNSYRPRRLGDESAAMRPDQFRALVSSLVSQRLAFRAA